MEEIIVSIVCNVYNHEKYLKRCLDSFVNQVTSFSFEVLIHDDASTDNSANIIKEYEIKYPNIIKPIYQKENQYSKGISISLTFQYPRVRGKYIALCEGDDYWIDNFKLQKQVEALENNIDVDICAHGAIVMCNDKKKCTITPRKKNCIIPIFDVIYGGGGMVATNSLLFRRTLINNIPDFVKNLHMDYSLQIYGSFRGGMFYISDLMSVYNFLTSYSWSMRTLSSRKESEKVVNKISKMLMEFNAYSNQKYEEIIIDYQTKLEFIYILKVGPFAKLREKKYKKYKKELPFKSKLLLYLKEFIPFYFERKIKDK